MKLPVVNPATKPLCLLVASLALLLWGSGANLRAQGSSPAVGGTPGAPISVTRKPKKVRNPDEPKPSPRAKQLQDIPFPIQKGDTSKRVKIPERDLTGQLLYNLLAAEITRVDNEHVQLKEMNMDLFHPDGKEDFHVIMPTSTFNLKTRIITSEDPVTVKTQDFELTGEKMEFNTVDRTGRLLGKVRMLVHNLKQVAGQSEPAPKSE